MSRNSKKITEARIKRWKEYSEDKELKMRIKGKTKQN